MKSNDGVQSLHRALDILEIISRHRGHMAIGEIAASSDIPLPTIHRLLQTLVARGYVLRLPNRHYALGFRLMSLGLSVNSLLGANAGSILSRVGAELDATVSLVMLSGEQAEYLAQVPASHAPRMYMQVGRKVPLHCTAGGKALLATIGAKAAVDIVRRTGMPSWTINTITTEQALLAELERISARGYSIDEQEKEIGIRCVAVAFPVPMLSPMAISISGLVGRMTDELFERAVPVLRNAAGEFSEKVSDAMEGSPT